MKLKNKHILFILMIGAFNSLHSQTIGFYQELKTNLQSPITNISISANNKYFTTSSKSGINIWSFKDFKLLKTIDIKKENEIEKCYFSYNDSFLLALHHNIYSFKPDIVTEIWNWQDKEKASSTFTNSFPVFSKKNDSFNFIIIENKFRKYKNKDFPDSIKYPSKCSVGVCKDRTIIKFKIIEYNEVTTASISNDDKYLALGYNNGIITICDASTLETIDSIPGYSNINYVKDIVFSEDNRFLAYYYKNLNKAFIYDIQNKKKYFEFYPEDSYEINSIAFGPDLFAVSYGNYLELFQVSSKNKVMDINLFSIHDNAIKHVNDLQFIPNSHELILGGWHYSLEKDQLKEKPRCIVFDYKKYINLIEATSSHENFISKKFLSELYVNTQIWHKQNVIWPLLFTEKTFLSVSKKQAILWEKSSLHKIISYHFSQNIKNVVGSTDGKWILAHTEINEKLNIINTYDNTRYSLLTNDTINFKDRDIGLIAIDSNNKIYSFKSWDKACIYDLENQNFIKTYKIDFGIYGLLKNAIVIDGQILICLLTTDNSLILFDPYKEIIAFKSDFNSKVQVMKLFLGELYVGLEKGQIMYFDPIKKEFVKRYTIDKINRFENLELFTKNKIFTFYENSDFKYIVSIIDLNSGIEKQLCDEIFVETSGIFDQNIWYIIKDDKLEIIDIKSNKTIKEISNLKNLYGSVARNNNIYKFKEKLSTGENIVSLDNGEITKVNNRNNFAVPFQKKDELYITDVTLNQFSKNREIGIACLNKFNDTIKIVTKKSEFGSFSYIKISPDNNYAITKEGWVDCTLSLWNLNDFKLLKEIKTKEVRDICWNSNSTKFLYLEEDNTKGLLTNYLLNIYNINKGKHEKLIQPKIDRLIKVCFSPTDSRIYYGGRFLYEFNYKTGEQLPDYYFHPDLIESILFYPEKNYLVAGLRNGEIFVWSVDSKKVIYRMLDHNDAVIDLSINDGILVSSSEDQSIKLWNLDSGTLISTFYQFPINNKFEYCFIVEGNYYKASKNISEFIHFVKDNRTFPFEQFDLKYNRPDIVLSHLGYADSALIEAYHKAYLKRLKKMNFTEDMFGDDLHLPEIKIVNKANLPIKTDNNTLKFKIRAKDAKYKLDRINLWINDVAIYGINGISLRDLQTDSFEKDITVDLNQGNNKIQLSCLNEKGTESFKETMEITYNSPPVKNNLYLIVISVSEYEDQSMNLKYAVKDGRDIVNLFLSAENQYENSFIDTLFDKKATKENVLKLKKKLLTSKVDDHVILYVSGHGLLDENLDFYFATHDIDFNNPKNRGLPYSTLEDLLDSIPARKKLFLMDACHSGEVDKEEYQEDLIALGDIAFRGKSNKGNIVYSYKGEDSKQMETSIGLQNSFELMQELFTNLNRGSGAVVISAAAGKGYALESPEWNNGVFTYSVLLGLIYKEADMNHDKIITVSELRNYVINQVQILTKGKQKPTCRQENVEFDFRVW